VGIAKIMAPPAKRRRGSFPRTSLRDSILSSFSCDNDVDPNGPAVSPIAVTIAGSCDVGTSKAIATSMMLANMSCVSTRAGSLCMTTVRRALRDRAVSARAVVAVLLDDDEEGPPLCCATSLLNDSLLHPSDFDPNALSSRVFASLAPPLPGMMRCECCSSGSEILSTIIDAFVIGGMCQARDDVLASFMQPLLVGGLDFMRAGARQHAFRIATRTLECLKTVEMDSGERNAVIIGWIRTSVRVASESMSHTSGVDSITVH
jgi:hypothetical protein